MPKLSGFFESLSNLSQIQTLNIQKWLKFSMEPHMLENFLGNRIIYPQSIPMNSQEMEIDLAILREAIKLNDSMFYNPSKIRLIIPQEYISRFRPLTSLVWAFADVLDLKEVTKVFVKDWAGNHLVGTIIKIAPQTSTLVNVQLDGKAYRLKPGSLTAIPYLKNQGLVIANSKSLVVSGGEAGLFIDLRK